VLNPDFDQSHAKELLYNIPFKALYKPGIALFLRGMLVLANLALAIWMRPVRLLLELDPLH
jgi:hypothetical protein